MERIAGRPSTDLCFGAGRESNPDLFLRLAEWQKRLLRQAERFEISGLPGAAPGVPASPGHPVTQGGEGFGTMGGEEKTREYLEKTGFRSIETNPLPHDVQNNWHVVKK